jgi:hypothetical protein
MLRWILVILIIIGGAVFKMYENKTRKEIDLIKKKQIDRKKRHKQMQKIRKKFM